MRSGRLGERVIRVVLDTNVWVSSLIRPAGPPGLLVDAVRARKFEAVVSPALAGEVLEVIERPRLRRQFELDPRQLREFLDLITHPLPSIAVPTPARDPDDVIIVQAAVAGQAEVIVTGDRDLQEDRGLVGWLAERRIEVLRPGELLARLKLPS